MTSDNTNLNIQTLAPTGEIHGYQWNDLDGNGIWDTGESALSGWTVYLDENKNGQLDNNEISAITDNNGAYSFTNLDAGNYTVAAVNPQGWQATGVAGINGYIGTDSDQANGVAYDWIDISAVGTSLFDIYADDDSVQVDLPFLFPFFGELQTSVRISVNGLLDFDVNEQFVSWINNHNIISPLGADLFIDSSSSVYYHFDESQDQFIIQYQNVFSVDDIGAVAPLSFEIILESDGDIIFQYEDINFDFFSPFATVGIQGDTADKALYPHAVSGNSNYVYNTPIRDQFALAFSTQPTEVRQVSLEAGEIVTNVNLGTQNTTPPLVTDGDGTGNERVDIVLRNTETGENYLWTLDAATHGQTYSAQVDIPDTTNTDWYIGAVVDFDGNGSSDLLWRNGSTGENAVWYFEGSQRTSTTLLPSATNTDWQMVGAADFDGNGTADIVFRHQVTGKNAMWYMDGNTRTEAVLLPTASNSNWQVVGLGDVNGDDNVDILWRRQDNGLGAVWYMNGEERIGSEVLHQWQELSTDWQIRGTKDLNQDGQLDLLWRNSITGEMQAWYLEGTNRIGTGILPTQANPNLQAFI